MVSERMKAVMVVGFLLVLTAVAFSFGTVQAAEQEAADTYVIAPEDRLEINVWKEKDLSMEVLVRSDGMISLPLLDQVQAAGLTPSQLKKVIAEKLQDYLSDPRVSVIVKVPKKFKIYVLGNVKKPGQFELTHECTFLQAIALAEGLGDWASNKLILISKEGGKETRRVINYKDVISGEALDQNVVLKSGDTIVVP